MWGTERPCGGIPLARRCGTMGPCETRIWSGTSGPSPCLSVVRTRSSALLRTLVLKAQYVKNVFVPGEGLEPSCSSLWARRDTYSANPACSSDPGIPAFRYRVHAAQEFSPLQGSPRVSGALKAANPVLWDRVRERSCVCSSLPVPVLGWAGFLVETLEARVHRGMYAHA